MRTVNVRSSAGLVRQYVRVVESYRHRGRVKQRVVANLGRKDFLAEILPQLYRAVRGEPLPAEPAPEPVPVASWTWGPVLVARALFDQLDLWKILDEHLGTGAREGRLPYADRVFALVANRLGYPTTEHGLARWLETDFVCDRAGRRMAPVWETRGRVKVSFAQLQRWYRTLDHLVAAKEKIEFALYERLRDLFHLQPDLVFYDITSLYFEGQGPPGFAKHGHSRDGKPRNPQVVVGVVMVGGWPVVHQVFAGNTKDETTVRSVVAGLEKRFSFGRIVFVGDRGMVTTDNLDALQDGKPAHGYLVGLNRRRNRKVDGWIDQLSEDRWIDCPVGITASEKARPPRTRVQEVASGDEGVRVFVVESEERRAYERQMHARSLKRVRAALHQVAKRVAAGRLKKPEAIGAAAQRAMNVSHGCRYFSWELQEGRFRYFKHPVRYDREKRLDGTYLIATTEKDLSPCEAVQAYKELSDVERGFRDIKDLLGARPLCHQTEHRVRGHIFVAALAFLLDRLLERRLKGAAVDLSTSAALKTVETIRQVTFDLPTGRRTGVTPGSPRAQQVLKALGITDRRPPAPPGTDATIT